MMAALTLLTGCAAMMGTIDLKVTSDCAWARQAPTLSEATIIEINESRLSYETADELNKLDIFAVKHNELFARYCD